MDEDRIKGAATDFGGKAKDAIGGLMGDKKTQAEGKADQVSGQLQNAYGSAKDGAYVAMPFEAMLAVLRLESHRSKCLVIAEDLGTITPDVIALREALGLPGMAVLQFAFGTDPDNAYLPHNLQRDVVIYTGTHDNDTSLGWFAQAPADERRSAQIYLKTDGAEDRIQAIQLHGKNMKLTFQMPAS